jgi:uncharacterized membrane protein (DUF485 family)
MENTLLPIFAMMGIFLLAVSSIVACYVSRRWLWLSITCAFLAGFLPGVCVYQFWTAVAIGFLFIVIFVPGAVLTGLYRERARQRFISSTKEVNTDDLHST